MFNPPKLYDFTMRLTHQKEGCRVVYLMNAQQWRVEPSKNGEINLWIDASIGADSGTRHELLCQCMC